MRERKYKHIVITHDVYCNSLHQYSLKVYINHHPYEYSFGFGLSPYTRAHDARMPKYVVQEIERLIVDAHQHNQFSFYELDRDGNKRRSEYRYHDPELFRYEIERTVKS